MMGYTCKQLASACNGVLHSDISEEKIIRFLSTDSRKIVFTEKSMFIAITGLSHNGHDFIKSAYEKGVRCFLVSKLPEDSSRFSETAFILVPDTIVALQQIAARHRKQFDLPVIGITGSNGKTIVKEWLSQLLTPKYQVVKSPGSYNSQIGVPLSLWHIQPYHTLGLFEAGMSKPGEMARLAACIQPDIGVFTMIGEAHNENFKNIEEKITEKLLLFQSVHTLVYCRDHKAIDRVIQETDYLKQVRLYTWSFNEEADLRVLSKEKTGKHTRLQLKTDSVFEVQLPFTDAAMIENALHCIAVMLLFEVPKEEIIYAVSFLQPIAMRLEMKKGINGCFVINDAYNADMDSVRIALQYLRELGNKKNKTLILTDIHQSGRSAEVLYNTLASWLNEAKFSRLILIGSQIQKYQTAFDNVESAFTNTNDFLQALPAMCFQDEYILMKGAREFELERAEAFLIEKTHATVLEINLNAIAHNFSYYKSLLSPNVKMMAMVKAASYGTGDVEIAQLLEFYKADYLAVAYTDEGVHLRKEGIKTPIMVMNPEDEHYERMARYGLEPEIYSMRSLQRYLLFARSYAEDVPSVHIKLDTGMHRLGFMPHEIQVLSETLSQYPHIRITSIFSHLAASDNPDLDTFTYSQIDKFDSATQKIADAIGYMPIRHILNTGGIERFPNAQFDMVRLGIGLYGIGSNETQTAHLMQVIRLKTRISQIRRLPAGEPVGYGCEAVSDKERLIATVPIGYADGYRRSLGLGVGSMLVSGVPVPVVGKICMDMTMLDITDLQAEEGDEVIVMGPSPLRISDLAHAMQTIPYEVLTALSQRLKRVFVKE